MAKKKGNGQDQAALGLFQEMLEELRGIKAAQQETNLRLSRIEGEVGTLSARLESHLVQDGERVGRIEDRLSRVEAKVFG